MLVNNSYFLLSVFQDVCNSSLFQRNCHLRVHKEATELGAVQTDGALICDCLSGNVFVTFLGLRDNKQAVHLFNDAFHHDSC